MTAIETPVLIAAGCGAGLTAPTLLSKLDELAVGPHAARRQRLSAATASRSGS